MAEDNSNVDPNTLISENYLLQTDPQWQLRIALDDNDFATFKKLATSAAVDLEYVYQYPDYKTCLELAICEVSKKENKRNSIKHKIHYKVERQETFTRACQIMKKLNFVKFLLQLNVEVNTINITYNAAPIHFAIEYGNIGALEALLADDRINVNLKSSGNTALLLAVRKIEDIDDDREETFAIYINMIEMLLKAGCNVNLPNAKGVTPVFVAAKHGLESVVTLLLNYARDTVDLDSYKHSGTGKTARQYLKETLPHLEPIFNSMPHFATTTTDTSTLYSYLLSLDEINFINDYNNMLEKNKKEPLIIDRDNPETMLQLATEKGLEKAVEILLNSGTDPNATGTENAELPVTIACRKGYINILKMFIEISSTSFNPVEGESLLQTTIKGMNFSSRSLKINFVECINILLTSPKIKPPINVNHSDFYGNTALHYATRNGDQNIVLQLLRHGACVGIRNRLYDPPLADMNPNTLETYLDECVTSNSERISHADYEIRFKYSMLVNPNTLCVDNENKPPLQKNIDGSVISPEMAALVYMTKNEQLWPLLKHPVITSFLYLKWQGISCLYIINLAVYTIFWMNLISYILLENLIDKDKVNYLYVLNVFTHTVASIGIILLLLREVCQFILSTKYVSYFKKSKNWLEGILIFITTWFLFNNSSGESTKHQLSAITILLSSIELLLLIGHFPNLSTYIVMLKTVSANFFKFILWYCILIIAFALSFHVLFKNVYNKDNKSPLNSSISVEDDLFRDPGQSIFKTIVMLTGEFDAGSIKFNIFPITSHVIFIIFVFMIPIVLVNLLNGLAVSDTQKIRENAELVVLISTVQSISYIENIFIGKLYTNSRLWNCLPLCLRNFKFLKLKTLFVTPLAKRITLFPNFLPLYSIVVKPNRDNSIEIPHSAYHEDGDYDDVVEAGKCCFKIWQTYRLDQEIVKNAKILLNKRSQSSELNEIKSKLSQILQMLESR